MKYVQGAVWALLVLAFLAILYLVYRAALAARDAMAGLGKWGDLDSSLRIYQKTYGYTKEVLITAKLVQTQYDKIINDPSTAQNDREEIMLKQKRIKQIVPKYSSIKELTSYNLGYIYAKKGDSERARKYLSEVLEAAPFSLETDSLWMKTKTLLLSQYGLEGEF